MKRLQTLARRAPILLLLTLAAGARPGGAGAQEPPSRTNGELARALSALRAERGADLRVVEIGRSAGGVPLPLVRVAGRDGDGARPALLVVAGAHGPHTVGTEVALALLDSLLAGYGRDSAVTALLDGAEVLVLPRLNPDAVEAASRGPLDDVVRNATPRDDDRDGEVDEDGPDDLDGNGMITRMRIADPAGTWTEDPDDPGLMRPADPARGDRRAWKLIVEGRDDDDDGEWNEDPRGGTDPSANFPHGYRWFAGTTGDYPLAAPEARALAELLAERDGIAAVVVLGPQDNLAAPWKASRSVGRDPAPEDTDGDRGRIREPLERPLDGDAPWFAEVSRRYRERTGRTAADSLGTLPFGGDPVSWAYYQMGRWAFGSAVWTPPAPESPGTPDRDSVGVGPRPDGGDPVDPAAADAAEPVPEDGDGDGRRTGGKDDPVAAERRALRWLRAHRPEGFVDWTPVEHPDFPDRAVEVGGFASATLWTPPAEELREIARGEVEFLLELAASLPRLSVPRLGVESLGDGAWRVTVRVANEGFLPTRTELASRLALPRPIRVTLEGDGVEVVGGRRTQAVEDLPGGGAEVELSWVVVGPRGRRVTVRAGAPAVGEASAEVELR